MLFNEFVDVDVDVDEKHLCTCWWLVRKYWYSSDVYGTPLDAADANPRRAPC